ncbi:MAG: acetyl-CoA carboxylase carboxyltransferase subunit beta [Candidatus Marinimicrobia bacterium]|nr:acetyl-CoA carboxylase carboxyltransferase subunit beta [Candidatus Neomarinimicrobiota bacterium]
MVDWFKRKKKGILGEKKNDIPEGLWIKCPKCSEILYKKAIEQNFWSCPKCRYHFRIPAFDYIKLLFDEYEEFNAGYRSSDPLNFSASKKYIAQLKIAHKKTGLNDAIVTVKGKINGHQLTAAVMDFGFIGGSMGSVVGEKISKAVDVARANKTPLLIVSSSGGARMMEGILSLMQMAKTSAKLAQFSEEGGLYISLMTDPTTGGTTASYAMLGDINIAESGALVGFAGARVIKQTIGEDLPDGFQRAEFLLEKGFVDRVTERSEMKEELTRILEFFA